MSRDWTPQQLDYVQKTMDMPNLNVSLQLVLPDGSTEPFYSEEDIALSLKYPHLGRFGFDMLNCCRQIGVLSSKEGENLIQQVENSFNGEIEDLDLYQKTQLWYTGEFCPGYYMDGNNTEFAQYLKEKMKGN